MNRPPDTGNSDCDTFIRNTFVRLPHGSVFGKGAPKLLIKAIPHDVKLTHEQAQELSRYLRERFCGYCGGTQVDPEGLNGRCEYCGEMPF